MEQARNFVCKECSSPVPSGHKFCGTCGATVPAVVQNAQTDYFGAMQAPGKARLTLIRGDQGVEGLSYLLQGTEHVAGRQDAQILFPEDPWLSPRHANFIYRGEKLVVFKFRRRKRYKRKNGHRQNLTEVKITGISA